MEYIRVTRGFYRKAYHDGDSEAARNLGDITVLKTVVKIPATQEAVKELISAAEVNSDHVGQVDISAATARYARRLIERLEPMLD